MRPQHELYTFMPHSVHSRIILCTLFTFTMPHITQSNIVCVYSTFLHQNNISATNTTLCTRQYYIMTYASHLLNIHCTTLVPNTAYTLAPLSYGEYTTLHTHAMLLLIYLYLLPLSTHLNIIQFILHLFHIFVAYILFTLSYHNYSALIPLFCQFTLITLLHFEFWYMHTHSSIFLANFNIYLPASTFQNSSHTTSEEFFIHLETFAYI